MRRKSVKWVIALGILLFFTVFSGRGASAEVEKPTEVGNGEHTFEKLNPDKVTTKWNDSYLFSSREDALKELEALKKRLEEINETFRPEFENLSGPVLLDYLETDKEFSKSLEVLYIYAYTQNSKNMNDEFFASLLADSQDLVTKYSTSPTAVLHQLDQKIIYPHYDFKHLTEKYFEIGMKLRACLKIQPDLTIGIGLHI